MRVGPDLSGLTQKALSVGDRVREASESGLVLRELLKVPLPLTDILADGLDSSGMKQLVERDGAVLRLKGFVETLQDDLIHGRLPCTHETRLALAQLLPPLDTALRSFQSAVQTNGSNAVVRADSRAYETAVEQVREKLNGFLVYAGAIRLT